MPTQDLQWIINHGRLRLTATPVLYHCEPIWSWRVDALPDYALLLILDGRGKLSVNQQTFSLRQGICFFLKPGTRIEAQQNPSYPLFLFLARFDILNTKGDNILPDTLSNSQRSVFIRNVRNLESLAEVVSSRGSTQKEKDPLLADALNMLVRLIVEEAAHHAGDFDSKAYEALHSIENDLARKWTVKDLAHEASMPARAFATAFRRMMNEPPIHYVIRRRMEEAKRQILQSSLPIDEIAINLGYDDVPFFRDLFRSRLGQSPESLRSGRAL